VIIVCSGGLYGRWLENCDALSLGHGTRSFEGSFCLHLKCKAFRSDREWSLILKFIDLWRWRTHGLPKRR